MFSKMLGKSLSKEDKIIAEKVAKMNLVDMRIYVNDKLSDFEITQEGLTEVMRRLVSRDAKDNRFIESDAMDSKIKKAFDLVILIASSKKITVSTLELIQEFIDMYNDLIVKYDQENKDIYALKLKEALNLCIKNLATIAIFNQKMGVLSK